MNLSIWPRRMGNVDIVAFPSGAAAGMMSAWKHNLRWMQIRCVPEHGNIVPADMPRPGICA